MSKVLPSLSPAAVSQPAPGWTMGEICQLVRKKKGSLVFHARHLEHEQACRLRRGRGSCTRSHCSVTTRGTFVGGGQGGKPDLGEGRRRQPGVHHHPQERDSGPHGPPPRRRGEMGEAVRRWAAATVRERLAEQRGGALGEGHPGPHDVCGTHAEPVLKCQQKLLAMKN